MVWSFRRVARSALVAAGVLWVGTVSAQELPETTRTLQDGVYTERQAARGQKTFARYCAGCHQPVQFTRNGLLGRHEGGTLLEAYNAIKATMPQDSPGKLKPKEYAVVFAYMFSLNDLPTGKEALEMEDSILQDILMTGLKTTGLKTTGPK